ncbi:hypothetical protein GOV12_05130 [Candidatus Pacearchaeota archaeon]|nr:hypothetical protein [Candidatus Pacearchaeota archaeon]
MNNLEQTLSFKRPKNPIFGPGTEFIYDPSKVDRFRGMLRAQLEKKQKVDISKVAKLAGLREVALELQTLSCGFEFLLPVESETRKPFFNGNNIAFFRSMNESGDKHVLSNNEDGVYSAGGFYYRKGDNWKTALNNGTPIEMTSESFDSEPFFRPEQLFEMIRMRGNFNLTEAEYRYVAQTRTGVPFVTKSKRQFDLGDNEFLYLRSEVRINSPDKISKFKLEIDRQGVKDPHLPYVTHKVEYRLEVEIDDSGNYNPSGYVWVGTRDDYKTFSLDINRNGTFSEIEGIPNELGDVYRFVGHPTTQVDFARTITNTFEAANKENPYAIINKGCLLRI